MNISTVKQIVNCSLARWAMQWQNDLIKRHHVINYHFQNLYNTNKWNHHCSFSVSHFLFSFCLFLFLPSFSAFLQQQLRNLSCPTFLKRERERERCSLHDLHESNSSVQLWPDEMPTSSNTLLSLWNTWTHTNPDICIYTCIQPHMGVREHASTQKHTLKILW